MMLNVGHFAGLGVMCVPKRHADSALRRVPKRPTRPDVREDVEREHLARLASAIGRRIMNIKSGLEIQGAMGRRRAEETKLKSNSLTLRVFRRLRKEEI
jgi:hypothetical protein